MTTVHGVNIEQAVEDIKRSITEDIDYELVPRDISSFADLHDHVDANEYLVQSTEHLFASDTDEGRRKAWEVANAVESIVTTWLFLGRPTKN